MKLTHKLTVAAGACLSLSVFAAGPAAPSGVAVNPAIGQVSLNPPPPPSGPKLNAISLSPTPIPYDTKASVVLSGSGLQPAGCAGEIDWGDGTKFDYLFTEVGSGKWLTFAPKKFNKAGTFTLTAKTKANASCSTNSPDGTIKLTYTVAAPPPPQPPVLTSMTLSSNSVKVLDVVNVAFTGTGTIQPGTVGCAGDIDFGDGSPPYTNGFVNISGNWITTFKHTFYKSGVFTVTATPKSLPNMPCTTPNGKLTAVISVAPVTAKPSEIYEITRYTLANVGYVPPAPNTAKFNFKWKKSPLQAGVVYLSKNAYCAFKLDWGDGKSEISSVGEGQPGWDEEHTYPGPGTYNITITPNITKFDSEKPLTNCTVSVPMPFSVTITQ